MKNQRKYKCRKEKTGARNQRKERELRIRIAHTQAAAVHTEYLRIQKINDWQIQSHETRAKYLIIYVYNIL